MYAHIIPQCCCLRVFTAVFQSSAQSLDSLCEASVMVLFPPDAQKSQTADGVTVAEATMASDGLNLAVLFRNVPVNRTTGTMKTAGSERMGWGITEVIKGALQGPCTAKWANIWYFMFIKQNIMLEDKHWEFTLWRVLFVKNHAALNFLPHEI